jgi:CRP-like cAMP-binding protein
VTGFRKDAKISALKESPLFEGLSRKQLALLAQLSEDLEVPSGTVLCKEGSRGREFFVIIDGEAEVTMGGRHVRTVGPGEFFGEIALIAGVSRTATVTPLRHSASSSLATARSAPSLIWTRRSSASCCERWHGACCQPPDNPTLG